MMNYYVKIIFIVGIISFFYNCKKDNDNEIYHVGDYYPDKNNSSSAIGVVAFIDELNHFGLLVSIDEAVCAWSTGDDCWSVSESEDDGMKNMDLVKTYDPDFDNHPAFKWCASKGNGWYLPAIDEIQNIHHNIISEKYYPQLKKRLRFIPDSELPDYIYEYYKYHYWSSNTWWSCGALASCLVGFPHESSYYKKRGLLTRAVFRFWF